MGRRPFSVLHALHLQVEHVAVSFDATHLAARQEEDVRIVPIRRAIARD
jgi:hypothetical protein